MRWGAFHAAITLALAACCLSNWFENDRRRLDYIRLNAFVLESTKPNAITACSRAAESERVNLIGTGSLKGAYVWSDPQHPHRGSHARFLFRVDGRIYGCDFYPLAADPIGSAIFAEVAAGDPRGDDQ